MKEKFEIKDKEIIRTLTANDGTEVSSNLPLPNNIMADNMPLSSLYDYAWLRMKQKKELETKKKPLNLVDLFCGLGPMSLGVVEAGRALGIEINPILAIDFDSDAAKCYKLNFPTCNVINGDITQIIDGELGCEPTQKESELLKDLPALDIVIGGPPCQGHSDLNNHTRRDDPRNQLILRFVRFIELTRPRLIIIENVQGIRHDKNNVLEKAKSFLESFGYHLKDNLLLASDYGVAQRRRRYLLSGSLSDFSYDIDCLKRDNQSTVDWAINDLEEFQADKSDIYNTSARHSATNQERINYLHDNGLYELPNSLRPKCQQKEDNRYTSVYSRMHPDCPAPTITSGFGSIGQGRFGHPRKRRSITPHEAARIQFIPDFYIFPKDLTRVSLQKLIGNAVPPKLTYVIALNLLQ